MASAITGRFDSDLDAQSPAADLVRVYLNGIGKTALLNKAIESASDLQVARADGVESERELPFAALHQLCAPMLDRLERLPGPQHDALATTFGLRDGAVPDRFLIGLAVDQMSAVRAECQSVPRRPADVR